MSAAGRIVTALGLSAAMVLGDTPQAFAEVCDKVVGEWWTPAHGPVASARHVASAWVLIILFAALLFGISRAKSLLATALYIVGAITLVLLDMGGYAESKNVIRSAIAEGCLSDNRSIITESVSWLALALTLVLFGIKAALWRNTTTLRQQASPPPSS